MKALIQGVKGMRDFYPEDMAVRSWLYQQIGKVSNSFGYQEYDGPFIEKLELYAAKSGDELVKEQSFVFPDRRGDLIALRPELTPSLARMIAFKQGELTFPARWWSYGPFWRYEQPQKGRTREFFQWNIDLIGANSAEADAELLSIACSFLRNAGLKPEQVKILVNNRQLMETELANIGIGQAELKKAFHLIDRKDKLKLDAWKTYAVESGFTESQVTDLLDLLDNKDLWQKSETLTKTFSLLEKIGFAEFLSYDPNIIRGLEYYTGTVFEARDSDGEFRAILGGGRYDNLVADVGGLPVGGIGFAMGDVVIRLVLQKYGCLPVLNTFPAQVMVTIFDAASAEQSIILSNKLRTEGINVVCYPEPAKLQKQFKYADKTNVKWIIVVGPDETAQGSVMIKDLSSGTQELVTQSELSAYLKTKVA